jgi:uroporphyrinogen III methyltransferase/synthase
MTPARVYLIGAGPGDPSLISVKGLRYLSTADVVVYDRLVHARLLRSARPEAEQINVGAPAPHSMEQDAINILLADKAREGKTVARLKYGDPFIFDSGGKEALFLYEQQIPFEVVPGVPSTVGGPCYAGVPLTYPEAGDALVFIRGHETETSVPADVDWQKVTALDGTVVSYGGAPQLEVIINELLAHGRSPDETAALIINGTLPTQRTIQGTLVEVQGILRNAQRRGSGVLVVGPVVGFREYLRWFDSRPLFGKRILVTRPEDQAADLVDRLLSLGADPVEAPTIRVEPLDDYGLLDEACELAGTFDWVVFTSVNGVEHFMHRLRRGTRDIRQLKGVRLCAVGPSTAERLARYGLSVDLIPDEHRSEAVVDALREREDLAQKRVLLPRGDLASDALPERLGEYGAEAFAVTAYRTVLPGGNADEDASAGPDIYKMLLEQELDVVTFTSASSVRNFVKILGAEPAADLLNTIVVAVIGPVTRDAATRLGIDVTIMPASYTIPALVDAIAEHFASTSETGQTS